MPLIYPIICPICGRRDFEVAVPQEVIAQEIRLRERFVLNRIEGEVKHAELKDRIDVIHDSAVDILSCMHCHLLLRDKDKNKPEETFEEDPFDKGVMEHFLETYINAFRERESEYRGLLPEGADVVEIGSYVGGFLYVAEEWGWNAAGIDPGRDVSMFANSKGYVTYDRPLEECDFSDESFDGVFIWNCFDQIDEPGETLESVRRILKEGGLLVIRTPNGLFYRLCRMILEERRKGESQPDDADPVIKALGHNNLLGFSYQYGYSSYNLNIFLRKYGFEPVKMLNSALITLPLSKTPDWAIAEEQKVMAMLENISRSVSVICPNTLTGPWMEISYRKISG